jgi:hypothetical protein
MSLAILHLSDIHFASGKNPVQSKLAQLAAAVNSVSKEELLLIVISGDIAFSGSAGEYTLALDFFSQLIKLLAEDQRVIRLAMVPGNHDCSLPAEGSSLRSALIQGLLQTLSTPNPDQALLTEVLDAQKNYRAFQESIDPLHHPALKLFDTLLLKECGYTVQINSYNTALLSRRPETQGELSIPVRLFEDSIRTDSTADLSLSLFHHSYVWLESNVAMAFRGHIERTSDFVFTGHQHFQHTFHKANITGENVQYFEGSALQDENNKNLSSFNVILADLDTSQQRLVTFKWSDTVYKPTHDTDWHSFCRNAAARSAFRLSSSFAEYLAQTGVPLRHSRVGSPTLQDIFVMPNVKVNRLAVDASMKEVRGDGILKYVKEEKRIIFQAPAMAGKSSLLKRIFIELFQTGEYIPIHLEGKSIHGLPSQKKSPSLLWRAFSDQYSDSMLTHYQQLSKSKRAVLIDDWHKTTLNADGRREWLDIISQYAEIVVLFADDMFSIQELVEKSTSSFFTFSHASIDEFRAELRGQLVEKWVSLGQEYSASPREPAREVEDTERLIKSAMGKNTLPSRPFIILTLLQAAQEGKAQTTEAGSFGYLYEVLVTTALSASQTATPQLEKKYVLLAMLAHEMFKADVSSVSENRIRQIAAEYARSHLVKIDIDSMLADLTHVRALVRTDGTYSFGYSHLFYFFVARYYRDKLQHDINQELLAEIEQMVDNIGSDRYSTILLFIIYFARNTPAIVSRLVSNANWIYADVPPADLVDGVSFVRDIPASTEADLPDENADLAEQRKERRRSVDTAEERRGSPAPLVRTSYSDDLTDPEKFRIGTRHIELLGQVLRNFPGSLPGNEKLEILRSCYLLGLRLLNKLFDLLTQIDGWARDAADSDLEQNGEVDAAKMREMLQVISKHIAFLGRMVSLGMISKVSTSVGLPDLEQAYEATTDLIGATDATRLINIAIRLEHFGGFPESEVRALHRDFKNRNKFADRLLLDLVLGNMTVYGADRAVRLRMMSEFNLKPNIPRMLQAGNKK